MAKPWEQMTEPEKIEELRRDVVRIFAGLREFDSQIQAIRPWGPLLNGLQQRLEQAEKALGLEEK